MEKEKKKLWKIIKPDDVKEEMTDALLNGRLKGTTTYISDIDQAWTWRIGEVNIWTGYANEGKGTFIRFLSLIKALEEKKNFYFYIPEDGPADFFFDKLIHTLSGKSTDKDNKNFIGPDLWDFCYELIKDRFHFLHFPVGHNTIEGIVECFEDIAKNDPDAFGFIIDPYVRVMRSKYAPDRDDLYGAYLMNYLSDFAAEFPTVTVHMVMHQQTPKRDDNKVYPQPNMYTIKSGGTFADVTDNVLSIWRPLYAKDKQDTTVHFTSEKIKKQELVGVPQTIKLRFNPKTHRYVDANNPAIDLYPFEKWTKSFYKKLTDTM